MPRNSVIPIILCGGSGSRLWPLSRKSFPKQFLKLNSSGNNSLLQNTYKRVSNIDPKISIATVYRTVKLFEESGILMKHDFKDGKARYELNDDHNHLIDIKSGNIIEFTDEEIEKIQKRIAEKHGYKLVDSKLELYCVKK